MIRIQGKVSSNIRDDVRLALLPLLELGERLAEEMRARIHEQGLAGDGQPWSSYKSKRKPPKRGDRFFWTKVGDAQPEKHRVMVGTQGKWAGRAAYPSYAHYREALGATDNPNAKRFVLTGELRDSLEVTASRPGLVTITYNGKLRQAPYGKAKSGKPFSNQKVAQFAFRTERMSPMVPTAAELERFRASLVEAVPAHLLKRLELASLEAKVTARTTSLTRRANRLLSGPGVRV